MGWASVVTRRGLLAGGGAVVVAGLFGRPVRADGPPADPFTLGVASGDPAPDGFVIWTRLAVTPMSEDGRGGMGERAYQVWWQVGHDERFSRLAASGTTWAEPAWGHSVHVEPTGLEPGREYFYRFGVDRWISPAGRTRTAPAPTSLPTTLGLAFLSCSQYEHGFFTGYRRIAESEPELILHLGDYVYEYAAHTYNAPGGNARDHAGPETRTLANYRQRFAQYKLDPDLRAAHAAAPWLAVFDDHEVDNNWAGPVPERPDPAFAARRTAAMRAYWENMPLRGAQRPHGAALPLHRRVHWGRLATFHLLDTRQHRDDQGCGDGYRDCPAATDPARSILGAAQESWLLDGYRRSVAVWDVMGQQVFFSQRDRDAGPVKSTSQDAWDGYAACRDRIVRGWREHGVRNAVVLTGDVHAHWAAEVKAGFDDPDSPAAGSELVCSSLTTGGDGADSDPATHPFLAHNRHLRLYNGQRGYVRGTVTPAAFTADFMTLPYVRRPGAPAQRKAGFVIEDGVPGPQLRYLRPFTGPQALSPREQAEATVRDETVRP